MEKSPTDAATHQQQGTYTFSMVTEDTNVPYQPVVRDNSNISGRKHADLASESAGDSTVDEIIINSPYYDDNYLYTSPG